MRTAKNIEVQPRIHILKLIACSHLLIVLILLPSFLQAQHGPINVHLKSGDILSTSYAYLNSNPGFSRPYVRLDQKKGKKVPIETVQFLEGIDEHGVYRYFKPIQYSGREIWGERTFNSERIEVYYTDVQTGAWVTPYRSKYFQYSKDGSPLKKVNYANLKADITDNASAQEHLRKGNRLRVSQILLYGLGAALIVSGISSDFNRTDTLRGTGQNETAIGVPPALVIGAITLYIPWLINGSKQNHYRNALRSYN